MTPDHLSYTWNLDHHDTELLTIDFISGMFFYLIDRYTINSLSDYAYSSEDFFANKGIASEAQDIGKSLPTYNAFKQAYPEYFI